MTEFGFDLHSYAHGIRLFNERKFFDAHEVLEEVWRAAPRDRKKFLQGLIQLAVALHHHSRGNRVGAMSLLRRAARNLGSYPEDFAGISLKPLVERMHQCADALERGLPLPSIPHLEEPEC
ncbi:MAG: DUF309 domain-containing protein [Acidobacteria bacterium]|nr:DUF309 domain-containing protein [Acidobacteriota bacterium]